jgi:hypothetical protein
MEIGDATHFGLGRLLFEYTFDGELSLQIAWTLSLLARGSESQLTRLVDEGLIACLLSTLAVSCNASTKQFALRGLTELIGRAHSVDAVTHRLLRCVHALVGRMSANALHEGHPDLLRQIAVSVHTLCDAIAPPSHANLVRITRILSLMRSSKDALVLQSLCWALRSLLDADDYRLRTQHIVNGGFTRFLVRWLSHKVCPSVPNT